jgi:hypothetical protein
VISTGADRPVIVYMSVPDSKKGLLPDINTIFSSIRPVTTASSRSFTLNRVNQRPSQRKM